MLSFLKEMVVTGLGALVLTKEKIEDLVDELVKEGKVSRDEAEDLVDSMVNKAKKERKSLENKIRKEVDNSISKTGLSQKKEVEELNQQLNKLELHITDLEREIENIKEENTQGEDDGA